MSHDRDVNHCSVCGLESWDNSGECYNGCKEKEISLKAKQIGGNHYEADYQHWDWAMDVRLGYFESAASKYAFRWYKKNGIEDLEKARSYLLKAKEGYLEGRWENKCLHVDTWPLARDKAEVMFEAFITEATVPTVEADLCLQIAQWRNSIDLDLVIDKFTRCIDAAQALLDTGGAIGPLLTTKATRAAKTGGSGQAGGTAAQPAPSSASVELTTGNPEAHDYLDHYKSDHPAPFGYDGEA